LECEPSARGPGTVGPRPADPRPRRRNRVWIDRLASSQVSRTERGSEPAPARGRVSFCATALLHSVGNPFPFALVVSVGAPLSRRAGPGGPLHTCCAARRRRRLHWPIGGRPSL